MKSLHPAGTRLAGRSVAEKGVPGRGAVGVAVPTATMAARARKTEDVCMRFDK